LAPIKLRSKRASQRRRCDEQPGVEEVSENSGISIINVDTIVARQDADAVKLDAVHLKPQGYSLVAEQVVRVLDDLGVLDTATL